MCIVSLYRILRYDYTVIRLDNLLCTVVSEYDTLWPSWPYDDYINFIVFLYIVILHFRMCANIHMLKIVII